MPNLDIVRQEILEAVVEEFGAYSQKRAERAADRAVAAFRAHGWEVFTWDEINADDLPRFR